MVCKYVKPMADAMDSETTFNAHKEPAFWTSHLNRVTNMVEYFRSVRWTFVYGHMTKVYITQIRKGAEEKFAEAVRKQIRETEVFKFKGYSKFGKAR